MYQKRTDLALETRELHAKPGKPDGIESEEREENGIRITTMRVSPDGAANGKAAGKPAGTYVTLDIGPVWDPGAQRGSMDAAASVLAEELRKLLPKEMSPGGRGCVLVAGLGNDRITPDSIGPRVVSGVLVTRHIRVLDQSLFESAGFGELAAIAPGVLGQTGVESAEIIRSVAERIRPSCVIAIDALASRRLSRLASTVQLSDTGICPGSGVSNTRTALSKETLGVPVISIGIPTVVDAGTLAYDLLEELAEKEGYPADLPVFDKVVEKLLDGAGKDFFITPRDSDTIASAAAGLIAAGINLALHDRLTPEEIKEYLSST